MVTNLLLALMFICMIPMDKGFELGEVANFF
jgi:hypothetical protein